MTDTDDDIGADLSKKERLINAWIAVGPEGKTTDVSDLTGSSRGYASDVRRAMANEDDEDLGFDEITAAHEPALVEQYRSALVDDGIDGRWHFADRLSGSEPTEDPEPPGPATDQPVSRSRASPDRTGPTPQATPEPGGPHSESGSGGRRRSQPGQSGRPSQQRRPAPNEQPVPPQSGGQGQPQPGPQSQSAARGQPQPRTGGRPQQSGGQPQSAAGQPHPTAGGQAQPSSGPQSQKHPPGRQQPAQSAPSRSAGPGFHDRLAELDRQLIGQQQRAAAELNGLPQGSQAHAIAVSKYNLVVDLRESLRQLASVATSP
jgi:hypothetical protein